MNTIDWEPNDEAKNLAKSDSLSIQNLEAMRMVARMKEAADNVGAGFVGGFITPTGQRFMMSNVDENDLQMKAIERQLDGIQMERKQEIEHRINNIDAIMKMLEEFEG